MKQLTLLTLFLIPAHLAFSQSKQDTLRLPGKETVNATNGKIDSVNHSVQSKLENLKIPGDTINKTAFRKADSIRASFQSNVDSLQTSYQRPVNQLDSASRSLQHRINSLQSLKMPTNKLTAKLDSVNNARTQKLSELNQKINHLKANAARDLKEINLPPEMEGPMKNLEQSIQGFKIATVDGKIPNLSTSANIPGLQVPGLGIPIAKSTIPALGGANVSGMNGAPGLNGVPEVNQLNDVTKPVTDLSKVTGQVGEYGKDVKNISQGKLDDVKSLDKVAENEAMKREGMSELKDKTGEIDKYKDQLGGRPDSAALDMLKSQSMPTAVNHFAGQEKALQGAMNQMARLKSKYSQVKSVANLPKRLPNPLHDTPFIERIVPGVTFQLYNQGHFIMDVTPAALYKITPRFSAGAGWVQRIRFDKGKQNTDHVYGPRAILQFNWSQGFSLRFQPELLNTFIPPQLIPGPSPESGSREWVWGAMVGIKKDFKVYKKIKGNTELVYNLYNPESKSPYPDRLMVRFGFEFPLKKRTKVESQ